MSASKTDFEKQDHSKTMKRERERERVKKETKQMMRITKEHRFRRSKSRVKEAIAHFLEEIR